MHIIRCRPKLPWHRCRQRIHLVSWHHHRPLAHWDWISHRNWVYRIGCNRRHQLEWHIRHSGLNLMSIWGIFNFLILFFFCFVRFCFVGGRTTLHLRGRWAVMRFQWLHNNYTLWWCSIEISFGSFSFIILLFLSSYSVSIIFCLKPFDDSLTILFIFNLIAGNNRHRWNHVYRVISKSIEMRQSVHCARPRVDLAIRRNQRRKTISSCGNILCITMFVEFNQRAANRHIRHVNERTCITKTISFWFHIILIIMYNDSK